MFASPLLPLYQCCDNRLKNTPIRIPSYLSVVVLCIDETCIFFTGVWGIGIATKRVDLNKLPLGCTADSWVLRSEGTVAHNNIIKHRLTSIPAEGDIIVSILNACMEIKGKVPPQDFVSIFCLAWTRPVPFPSLNLKNPAPINR